MSVSGLETVSTPYHTPPSPLISSVNRSSPEIWCPSNVRCVNDIARREDAFELIRNGLMLHSPSDRATTITGAPTSNLGAFVYAHPRLKCSHDSSSDLALT